MRITESEIRRIIREEATNLMKNKKSLHEMQHHSGRSDDFSHLGMTPAYLRELARRVTRGEDPEAALGSLAQQKQIAS